MSTRERIATILFIEQIKHTDAMICKGVMFYELVSKDKKDGDKTKDI